MELFGIRATANGPESRPDATGHDDEVGILHSIIVHVNRLKPDFWHFFESVHKTNSCPLDASF